ncbi:Transcription factor Pur-alpha 1 [Linum grandiflorum]
MEGNSAGNSTVLTANVSVGGNVVGGGGGGNDVELMCKTLQVEHKLFYFDLKDNPRGRYLKISEKTSSTRSTIIVPSSGIAWFLDLFNYYVTSDEQDLFSKELPLDTKVFYFDVGDNRRGRFLKISEASVSRNRSTIIVPAGSSRVEGWASFRNILEEINEASRLFLPPGNQVDCLLYMHTHTTFRISLSQ